MSYEVTTEARIAAPPARVWEVLVDFASYPVWNPVIAGVSAELREGARGKATFVMGRAGRIPIRIVVERVKPNEELVWSGGPKGLFHGAHYFRMREITDGATRATRATQLTHGEVFSGAAVRLAHGVLRTRVTPVYQSITDALKRRCEAT